MEFIDGEFLWSEKYRPQLIEDMILPVSMKQMFHGFVEAKNIPNLMLVGPSGVGKTTVAKAILRELACDYIVINGSLERNIDTLRNEILDFASSVSFSGGRKYVMIDEADYLNAASTQPALRAFMEEFSSNCGFIFTCNYPNKIIEHIHSRFTVIEFNFRTKDVVGKLASQFMRRICSILENEDCTFDKKVVAEIIKKHYPDFRRTINELQKYAFVANGSIDSGVLSAKNDIDLAELVAYMKSKDFTEVRKWIARNFDGDTTSLFRKFYDGASDLFTPDTIPSLVMTIAEYQYKASFVADLEVNMAAALVTIMITCEFK